MEAEFVVFTEVYQLSFTLLQILKQKFILIQIGEHELPRNIKS